MASVKTKIKSSHDVSNDPHLLKGEDLGKELVKSPFFFTFSYKTVFSLVFHQIDCIYTFDVEISFTFSMLVKSLCWSQCSSCVEYIHLFGAVTTKTCITH